MSSHCYKKYAAFLPRKWLKTAYFCIEDVILLSQGKWENDTLLPENPIFNLVFQ